MKIKIVNLLVILLTSGCAINQGYQGPFTNKVVATNDATKLPSQDQKTVNPSTEKARADQLAKLKAAAAADSKVPGGSYADKVRRKVKPFIVFNPDQLVGNPAVVIEVELAPDGAILNRNIASSSGDPNWDFAVLMALDRAQSMPKDDNGLIPLRQMRLTFKPKDGPQNAPLPAPSAKDTKPIQIDIGKLVVLYQPDADSYYPTFSKRAGEQGAVVIRLIINESGEVYEVALLQSSTLQRLDRAAIEIGKRYRFKPFLMNGAPVKISTNLLIKFNLKDDEQTSKQYSQKRINISELTVVFAPLIEAYFFPEYLKSHEGTIVSLELSIDEKGNVTSVTILNFYDPSLKDKAEKMAMQYRFKPYLVNGIPTKVTTILEIKLSNNKPFSTAKPPIEPPKAKIPPQQSTPNQKIQPAKEVPSQIKPAEKMPDTDPVSKFTNQVKEFLKPTAPVVKNQPAESTKPQQSAVQPNNGTPTSRLSALKEMLDKGLITEKDYNTKKQEILNSM
jgi:TonB family protein